MLEIRPTDPSPSGLEEVAELLAGMFPSATHIDAAYLDWTYRQNPDGSALGFNAYSGDRLVSHFAVTPLGARIDGNDERGVQMQHAATRPEFRGRGLFVELTERALRAGAEAGYGFAVGPANAASTPAFVDKLGFQLVRPFDVKLGVGPTPPRSSEPAGAPVQFERVWNQASLAWRLARPDLPYRVQRRAERANVFAPGGLLGIQVELGTFPSRWVPDSLPAASFANPLRVWIGVDPARSWSRRPYVDIPVRLRPAPLHFVFRDLSGRGRRLEPDRLRADMLDYDQF